MGVASVMIRPLKPRCPRKGGGHRALGQIGIQRVPPGGMIDVADHEAHGSVLDQTAVHLAVGCFPFVDGHGVDADQQMLVHLVHSIAWKMLDGHSHMVFIRAALVGFAEREHFVRVLAVGAHVDDGIAPVQIQIAYRRKSEIAACGSRFFAGNITHPVSVLGITSRADSQLLTEQGAVLQKTSGAKFQIRSTEQRDAAVVLHELKRLPNFSGGAGFEQQSSHMIAEHFIAQIIFIRGKGDGQEQLTDLFILRHGSQGVLNPPDLRIAQTEGVCSQINAHAFASCFLRNLERIANSLFR